jgi:thioredoxin reductase (NADPH)
VAFDYEVVIVGGGPAGLTAGLHLRQADVRVLVLEKDMFGGALQHTDRLDDYPGFPDGITGAQLAGQMIEHATRCGVVLEQADVSGVELFSRSRWVACGDGRGFSCGVVILAGGMHATRLGLPNEAKFVGRGVVDCTPCDGGFFVGHEVVIYGSTDHALRDALYLSELGARVTLLTPHGQFAASPVWVTRVQANSNIKVRHGLRLTEIAGSDRVESVRCAGAEGDEELPARGVLVRMGLEPNTRELEDVVELAEDRCVIVNPLLETSAEYVLACGDIRAGARPRVAAAVGDGAVAAARAVEILQSTGIRDN